MYSSLPSKPGVYLFRDQSNNILYVGKAKDLKKRVSSYFLKGAHDAKTTQLVQNISSVDHITVSSEIEAFLLEAELIKKHKPYYNIKFIDDKTYPYIMVSRDAVPYVALVRKKNIKRGDLFGPYPDAGAAKTVLKVLRKIFPYQSVKNHSKRKCLYYHLGLCPCVPAVPENAAQYKKNISNLKRFLKGQTKQVIQNLQKEQKNKITKEDFEDAGNIQKQIDAINLVTSETYDPFLYLNRPNLNVERERQENESLRLLLISHGLNLPVLNRIECYDISNFQGSQATGSMTVFINGTADKSKYRKFRIKKLKTPNDFAMHQEVMGRRLKHAEWGMPDLMIIDGGKGQVSSILAVMAHYKSKIPVIGLAKKFETLVIPFYNGNKIEFQEVRVPHSNPAINLARRIRDEAHRFAINYHRTLRHKYAFETLQKK